MPYPGWGGWGGQGRMGGMGGVAGQDPMRSAVAGALRRPGPAGPSGPGAATNPYQQMASALGGANQSMLGTSNIGAGQPGQFGPAPQLAPQYAQQMGGANQPQAGPGNPWSQLAQAMPGQAASAARQNQLMGGISGQIIPGSGMDYGKLMAQAAQGMQRPPQMAQGQFNPQNMGMTPGQAAAGGGASLNMGQLGQPGMQTLYGGGMNSAGGSYGR